MPADAVSYTPDLAGVRRLEAVGFRAWPAASVQYDGAWQIRLTAGHPSRRLNSVNPLDPSDVAAMEARVERAMSRFADYGRRPTFRLTPLASADIERHLDERGWQRCGETAVMTLPLDAMADDKRPERLPIRDVGRYVDTSLRLNGRDAALKPGLTELIGAIVPPVGLFIVEDRNDGPIGAALCVHDNDLAGIFELAVDPAHQGRGHARALLTMALRWARLNGARRGWLQVEHANDAAMALYRRFGFEPVYDYAYRVDEKAGR